MDKNITFANRSGFNLKFYKYDSTRAEFGYKADEDPLVVDFVNSCTLETTGDTVWATGGKGFKRLIGFDNPLEGTFNIETQVTNTPVWAMIAGQDPINFDPKNIKFTNKAGKRKFYYVVECDTTFVDEDGINYVQEVTLHKASVNRAFSSTYTGDGDPQSITIALDLAENGDDDLVSMSFDDGKDDEGGTEPGDGGTEPGDGGTEPGDGGDEPGDGGDEPGDGGGTDPEPDPAEPLAIDGATLAFTIDEGDTETLTVADYIDENDADGVTYDVSADNGNVTVSVIVDGEFTVEGVTEGTSIVTLDAIQGGTVKVRVEIEFTVEAV